MVEGSAEAEMVEERAGEVKVGVRAREEMVEERAGEARGGRATEEETGAVMMAPPEVPPHLAAGDCHSSGHSCRCTGMCHPAARQWA